MSMPSILSDTRALVRDARMRAAAFFAENPEAEQFSHEYPTEPKDGARVEVVPWPSAQEGLRVYIYGPNGHGMADALWDSEPPA